MSANRHNTPSLASGVAKPGNSRYPGLVEPSHTAATLLRELREAQKRSLRTAASDLGMAPSHLSRLERGERSSSPEVSRRLANYYGISSELLELADGRIPTDVIQILLEHPNEIDRLRSEYGASSQEGLT